MLTGRGTFDGKTVSDVLAGVLRGDPEWNALPPNLHPRIRLLLERCLEKEAKDRYKSNPRIMILLLQRALPPILGRKLVQAALMDTPAAADKDLPTAFSIVARCDWIYR